jgi:hypothetical protein
VFDSPFEFCPHCNEIVLLDQTKKECAHEHQCSKRVPCPLQNLFTGIDFSKKPRKGKADEQKR